MDPHTEDDNEESQYNDGRGLQFTVEFTGLIPPPAAGKKTQNNAKAPVIKKSIYVHEHSELNTLLNAALRSLGRHEGDNALSFSWIPRTGTYSSHMIDIANMTYTIPKTQFKEMSLTCEDDYKTLLAEVQKKAAPDAVKICLTELKYVTGDDDDEQTSEDEQPRKKKGKTHRRSAEEVEQTEFIAKLQAQWKCNDRTFERFLCFPDKTTAKHVHLTHFHLQTWAAAAMRSLQSSVFDI